MKDLSFRKFVYKPAPTDYPPVPRIQYKEWMVPAGWIGLFDKVDRLIQEWPDVVVENIVIGKAGLLRITLDSTDVFHRDMAYRIADSLTKQSSAVCMYCGETGRTRKTELGTPKLCTKHYIEYCNGIDEREYSGSLKNN